VGDLAGHTPTEGVPALCRPGASRLLVLISGLGKRAVYAMGTSLTIARTVRCGFQVNPTSSHGCIGQARSKQVACTTESAVAMPPGLMGTSPPWSAPCTHQPAAADCVGTGPSLSQDNEVWFSCQPQIFTCLRGTDSYSPRQVEGLVGVRELKEQQQMRPHTQQMMPRGFLRDVQAPMMV
jgi:hypothetical protein